MDIQKKIEELEKQLNSLKEEVKSCNVKYWKPKKGEKFYYGDITKIYCAECTNSDFIKDLFLVGNYFKTKEEAEEELELILATQRLKEAIWTANGGEFVGYNIHSMNYTVTVFRGKLIVNYFNDTKIAQDWMYFKDRETAIKVLEENRKDFEIYYGILE